MEKLFSNKLINHVHSIDQKLISAPWGGRSALQSYQNQLPGISVLRFTF